MITIVRLSLIVFAVGIFLPSSMAYSSMINDNTMDFDMSFLQMANRNDSSETNTTTEDGTGEVVEGDGDDTDEDTTTEDDSEEAGEWDGDDTDEDTTTEDGSGEAGEGDGDETDEDTTTEDGSGEAGEGDGDDTDPSTAAPGEETDGTTEEWTEVAIKPQPMGPCPWLTGNTGQENLLLCMDGYSCTADDTNHTDSSWQCCNEHGGRAKCPMNYPRMCASTQCGNGTAFCCEVDCSEYGGDRQCSIELPTLPKPPYLPINCTGTDFPMDAPIFPQNDTDATCPATEACFCECSVDEDCPSNVCYKPPGPINPMTGIPIEAPGICAETKCSLFIDGNVNETQDGMIDEDELAMMKWETNLNAPVPGIKEMILEVNSTAFLGIARKLINLFDEDMDNVLSMSECANLHKPQFPSEMSRQGFIAQDLNADGTINTTEIIRYHEDIGADLWTCCEEAAANCTLSTTEDCQKKALKDWFADELFPLANNETGPVESVTIAEAVLSDLIAVNEKRITPCGGCKWGF